MLCAVAGMKRLKLTMHFHYVSGWQWDAVERPTFEEIHEALETMFQNSSISEGKKLIFMCYISKAGNHNKDIDEIDEENKSNVIIIVI